jgi:fructokinase
MLSLTPIPLVKVRIMKWFGGIEAGGTKFNCIVAADPDNIVAETRIPTSTPDQTLPQVLSFFNQVQSGNNIQLDAIGLGSFGPIDPNPNSVDYGRITSTPKLAWRNTPILGYFRDALKIPAAFDTDVAAAALGEGKWGAAKGVKNFVYFTIGTGIGGGAIVDGKPVHGLLHPEMGHLLIPHDLAADPFRGCCPSHKDCLEGLASGPAMNKRWGVPAETLSPSHPAWQLEAKYISFMCANTLLTLSPERIILGGGVMKSPGLLELVRKEVVIILNGYIQSELLLQHTDQLIQAPGLGDRAGMLGCIALAQSIL